MKPADRTRVWRKTGRATTKGIPTGRRTSHKVETQERQPGSTWGRRHRSGLPMRPIDTSDGA